MKLIVVGTGSKGNCYILSNEKESLVIEAGASYEKILRGLNYNVKNVVGVVVSHSHLWPLKISRWF